VAGFDAIVDAWTRTRRDSLARASALAMLSRFSSVFLSLIAGIIVARSLGADGKGALAYVTTTANLAARLISLGLEASFTRFNRVKHVPADLAAGSVVWTTLALGVGGAIALDLVYYFVPAVGGGVPPTLVRATFWAMPPLLFLFVLSPILYGLNRELEFGAVDVAWKAGTLLVTVAAIRSAWNNIVAVGVLQLVVAAISAVGGFALLVRAVGGRLRWQAETLREMLAYSTGVYAYNTIRYALASGSMLLAGQLLSVADAGVFSVALMLGEAVSLVAASINLAFYPAVAVTSAPGAYARRVAGRVMMLCAAFGVGLLAVSLWIVPRLYGSAFAPAVPLFAALLPGVVLLGGEQVVASVFAAAGQTRPATLAVAVGAVLLPVLSVWLAGRGGIFGLAVACSIKQAVTAIIAFDAFRRRQGAFATRLT
jgi:O-antigen/teichoic acid export membrane protein